MPKKVVMIDAEDFELIITRIAIIRADLDNIPDCYSKCEVERRLDELDSILSSDY